jgi:hypothetical protein
MVSLFRRGLGNTIFRRWLCASKLPILDPGSSVVRRMFILRPAIHRHHTPLSAK